MGLLEDRPRLGRLWDRQVEGHTGRDMCGGGPRGLCWRHSVQPVSAQVVSKATGPGENGSKQNVHAQRSGPGELHHSAGDNRLGQRVRAAGAARLSAADTVRTTPAEVGPGAEDSRQGQRRRESKRTRTEKSPPALPREGRRPRGGSHGLAGSTGEDL